MEAIGTVYRVFCDESGNHGNPVGVFFDLEKSLNETQRQEISSKSGFSECVFVVDLSANAIHIHTPQQEIAFAGHAAVGVAFAIAQKSCEPVKSLRGIEGEISVSSDRDTTWVSCSLASTPPWWHERVANKEAVENIVEPPRSYAHTQVWAWINEDEGTIRSRTFAPAWGIPEDEANGSGCMRLAATLGRRIKVFHGSGSQILAQSTKPGFAEVGGAVKISHDIQITYS